MSIVSSLYILFIALTYPTGGGWRNISVIVDADSTIKVPDPWVVEGSVSGIWNGDTLFFRDEVSRDVTGIRFAVTNFNPGDTLKVIWQSVKITDRLEFAYYTERAYSDTSDSERVYLQPVSKPVNPLGDWGRMRRSGFISRGISLNESGSREVTSGLHLELSGEPSPGIVVEALLDDRNLPVGITSGEGSTPLRELDRLMLRVNTRHLRAELGDWDLNWRAGRWGTIDRQLKGGKLAYSSPRMRVETAAAGGESSFNSIRITPRPGDQGPYELVSRENRSGVTVLVGSDKVYLNGRQLSRGITLDYRIDYSNGTITFNPTIAINSDSRIEVEYEYAESSYARSFYGFNSETGGESGKLRWSLGTVLVQEGLDQTRPLGFEWNDDWREQARLAGDNRQAAEVSGIDTVANGEGDYVWGDSSGVQIIVFSAPDSLGRPTGYLRVEFSPDSAGGYRRYYDPELHLFYFEWVGEGYGDYSPRRYLPLPDRTRVIQTSGSLGIGAVATHFEAAVSDYDGNRLSNFDDNDNIGHAWSGRSDWRGLEDRAGLSIRINRRTERFRSLQRLNEVDYEYLWNIADNQPANETMYEGEAEISPVGNLYLTGSVGYLDRENIAEAERWRIGSEWRDQRIRSGMNYEEINGRNRIAGLTSEVHRVSGDISGRTGVLVPSVTGQTEERRSKGDDGTQDRRRLYEIAPLMEIGLPEDAIYLKFIYRNEERLRGNRFTYYADSRTIQTGWRGRRQTLGGWSVDLVHYRMSDTAQADISTNAANFSSNFQPERLPARLNINYRLSSGNSRTAAWVATYVGSGNGGWRREGSRYVPDPNGEFDLRTVATDTLRRSTSVDFTGEFEWLPRGKSITGSSYRQYPLGVSRAVSRLEARATTLANNPVRIILLDRGGLFGRSANSSFWGFEERVYFLDGYPAGNGRITFRREFERDLGFSGGEIKRLDALSFYTRMRLSTDLWLGFEPLWERRQRADSRLGALYSSVTARGADGELILDRSGSFIWSLRGGIEQRRDAVGGSELLERRARPKVVWRIGSAGSATLESEWRRLTVLRGTAGYDLTRSWKTGDNYGLTASTDYRAVENVTLNLLWRIQWHKDYAPLQSGLVEMTVML